MRADGETGNRNVGLHRFRDCRQRRYTEVFPEESMRGENRMLEFVPNTYLIMPSGARKGTGHFAGCDGKLTLS